MRAFLAIDVGRPVGPGFGAGSAAAAPSHLTLRFFGEVGPGEIDRILDVLPAVARGTPPFDLGLEGIGAFPSPERPRVVWLGVGRGRAEVAALGHRLDAALATVGLPAEGRELVPHVTLFRVRSRGDRERARALLDGTLPAPSAAPVRVEELALKESTLTPQGPEHRVVRAFPLGG